MTVDLDADSSEFTDEGPGAVRRDRRLPDQRRPVERRPEGALERWTSAGGGIAAVHNATRHARQLPLVGQHGRLAHARPRRHRHRPGPAGRRARRGRRRTPPPSTSPSSRWTRNDEWYNFSNNVRGTAHVLATMDETTYDAGSNAMGYDHPISWCKPYEGGRFWGTAMGHFPSHYRSPSFMQHIVGGVKYAPASRRATAAAPSGTTSRRSRSTRTPPRPSPWTSPRTAGCSTPSSCAGRSASGTRAPRASPPPSSQDVYSGGEDGMLGIALDPDFATNGHVFVYCPPTPPTTPTRRASSSRDLPVHDGRNGVIDPAARRSSSRCRPVACPTSPATPAAASTSTPQGNLYLGVGDDVNPHSEPSGGYAPLSTRPGTFHDARETSANTNDLRGKLLRITPDTPDGTGYTIPEGNLFPEAEDTGATRPCPRSTRWASATRSASRSTRRPARSASPTTRPTTTPTPRRPVVRPASPSGTTSQPRQLRLAAVHGQQRAVPGRRLHDQPGHGRRLLRLRRPGQRLAAQHRPDRAAAGPRRRTCGTATSAPRCPAIIPQGGGLAPMGGPIYDFDADLDSDTKFPASYDGKPFFYEWARNKMYSIQLKAARRLRHAGREGQPLPAAGAVPRADRLEVRARRLALRARLGRRLRP